MKATSIIDNIASFNNTYKVDVEEGFSLIIGTNNERIMIDCGESGSVLLSNARKLKVDLKSIDILVISHHHFDHVGGLWSFLKTNKKAKVYIIKPDFNRPPYAKLCIITKHVGFTGESRDVFKKYKDRIIFVDKGVFNVSEDVALISCFSHEHKQPYINNIVFRYDKNIGIYERDKFHHELAVLVRPENTEHAILVSPCSHHGILNIIEECLNVMTNIFDDGRSIYVIGGFHLMTNLKLWEYREYDHEIVNISEKMKGMERVHKVYTGHCTGYYAYQKMAKLNKKIRYLHCGEEITID